MKKESPLWSSISLLIGIVIAILALIRGRMLLPLLLAVFALWLLWWLLTQALPLWRNNRAYRAKEARLREQTAAANGGGQLADALLCHVNYRITAMLHAAYPNARWEWLADKPSRFAVEGGTARIRVYGIPDFDYADVKLDQKANLDCSLVKLSPLVAGASDTQPPNRQPVNPRVWFETRGRAVLEALVTDLNSRGHSSLTVQENGEVFVQAKENEAKLAKETFLDFPEKVYWPQLVKVLEEEGYRGKYYTLTDQRIPYRRDKTEDERFFILTLFAIAHEIEAMGQYRGNLMRVQLAVGLPPAHFGVQAKRFINYFNGRGAVAFQFKGKTYAIFIENTACFPQSFSAAAATVKNLASFPRALVVDIGGFTADYVRLRNGVPDMAACDSLENGVILLYNRICAKANAELDILLEESEIDRILRSEDQDAAPEVIALAEREAQEFINDLLSGLRERMLELKSGKVIFLGGGATLLRRQIEASGKIGQAIFVEDINANAKGYEYLYRLQHSGR